MVTFNLTTCPFVIYISHFDSDVSYFEIFWNALDHEHFDSSLIRPSFFCPTFFLPTEGAYLPFSAKPTNTC
jgi:hypothetical protein